MKRIRVVGTLVLAVALLAAACGDGGDAGEQPPEADTPATTQAEPDESVEAGDAAPTTTVAPAEPDGPDEAVPVDEGTDAAPADAATLLASATTTLEGRSVRGEATFELAPGFELSTSFESDAEGDLSATVEIPPGFEPEFPGGAEAEMRYVGGVVYVRPAVTAETLAELGLDEAWFLPEPVGDPIAASLQSAGGVMCIFPQAIDEAFEDCDPLGDTGTFLEAASEPEIVGHQDVRGVETTRVRFLVSLMDLAGEALGMETEADDGEAGAFDDSASDPFAEGFDQIFGFLDDAAFEVEVWIDDDSLIRRLAFDLASMFAGLAGGDAGAEMPSSLITLEFYDFDADISVDAPPPEAIVDEDLIAGDDDYATGGGAYEPSLSGCEEFRADLDANPHEYANAGANTCAPEGCEYFYDEEKGHRDFVCEET